MMWSVNVFACLAALIIISLSHWVYRWRNPKCNGKLFPGSMGLPFIGETIQLILPSQSIDIPAFVKKRMAKYGKIFRTNLVGKPVIMSCDAEFNHYVLNQEGKSVELWYMDSFAKIFHRDGGSMSVGIIHKYLRSIVLSHFGNETLREKLVIKLEAMVKQNLHSWSTQSSVDVKAEATKMLFDFTMGQLFGYDPTKSSENLSKRFTNFMQGLFSIPFNIPGTSFHKCMKNQKVVLDMIRSTLKERRVSPEKRRGDFLDDIMDDMKTHSFLTEDFIVHFIFAVTMASFEANSSALVSAIKFLTENPLVVKELKEEHEAILESRENADSGITWTEYKSMTFTSNVINETLRLANVSPGMLRRATKDVEYNGYTIPAGWTIFIVPSAVNLNPDTYEDPLKFNPWRWKELKSNVTLKNYIIFGGGGRPCTGAEFTKVSMAIFLHILVTKYSWKFIKGGTIVRNPILGFRDGLHIKLSEKSVKEMPSH
ncbi:hypothetical protein GIB67_000409 [Kingdonia uniflora]|uniref:Cytochrome P450 n=1 Tax=Kingdonia uniflora TaxID=39325 RepID=A0A7J7MPK5_9MAGN|nr:hypothetical protein GIB67_000409 [Kingdonia uniflora]